MSDQAARYRFMSCRPACSSDVLRAFQFRIIFPGRESRYGTSRDEGQIPPNPPKTSSLLPPPPHNLQVHAGGRASHLSDGGPARSIQLLHQLRPVPHESQVRTRSEPLALSWLPDQPYPACSWQYCRSSSCIEASRLARFSSPAGPSQCSSAWLNAGRRVFCQTLRIDSIECRSYAVCKLSARPK